MNPGFSGNREVTVDTHYHAWLFWSYDALPVNLSGSFTLALSLEGSLSAWPT